MIKIITKRPYRSFLIALFFVHFTILSYMAKNTPYTDDARFYIPAAQAYADWYLDIMKIPFTLDITPLTASSINKAFNPNHEHPPVGKYMMGLGYLLFSKLIPITDPDHACRMGTIIASSLLVLVLFDFVFAHWGIWAALASILSLLAMPRFLFHARIETLDLPVTAFIFFTIWVYEKSLRHKKWILPTIIIFAGALGTKLNAPFVLLGLLLHFLWLKRHAFTINKWHFSLAPFPLSLILMAVIAPFLVYLFWPWLWFDSWHRLQAYVNFHLHHYGILFYFLGTIYKDLHAPWWSPWYMLLVTTPIPILIMAAVGIGSYPFRTYIVKEQPQHSQKISTAPFAMVLIQFLVAIGIVSFSAAPYYSGVKLFLPALPFMAVLSGIPFYYLQKKHPHLATIKKITKDHILAAVCLVLLFVPTFIMISGYSQFELSYYNGLVGGIRGATQAGLERQYYDLAYPHYQECIKEHQIHTLRIEPNPKEYRPYFKRWRTLKELPFMPHTSLRGSYILLTHERRWPQYPDLDQTMRLYEKQCQLSLFDVPLATMYKIK